MHRPVIRSGRVMLGERFALSFQRTLRIPDDARTYPLPPGLGALPVYDVDAVRGPLPAQWDQSPAVIVPLYQREALWLAFEAAAWKPNAVKIGIGHVNAVSGEPWDERLRAQPQDYLVCPDQPWLDGINAGEGFVRQFVAMPLGSGYTVEEQLTGTATFGGIQVLVFEPKPGRFPDQPPPAPSLPFEAMAAAQPAVEMGLAAGGKIKQKLYPDPYGVETWDPTNVNRLFVHIVNSAQFHDLTGMEPGPSPVSAQTYAEYGLPWFDLYDERRGDLPAAERFGQVASVKETDLTRGVPPGAEEASFEVDENAIHKLHPEGIDGC